MILVTGGTGMVGRYCDWPDALRLGRTELDVRDAAAVRERIGDLRPEWVVHLAAETDVDACEREPMRAIATNALGTRNVALACLEFGTRLLYVSTSGVFDGSKPEPYDEFDVPDPPNQYARSKLAGERYVRDHVARALVVRASWVFGGGPGRDTKFVGRIVQQLRDPATTELRAVDDKFGSPTFARDLAEAMLRLMRAGRYGTVHVAGRGAASRYDIAVRVRDCLGLDTPVLAVPSTAFPLPAPRGRSEVLRSVVQEIDGDVCMRPWEDALEDYLRTEWA